MKPYIHKVQYYETDKMQITHHSNYIRFMEEARVYYLEQIGWGFDRLEAEGIASPVLSITCDYKKPTTFADSIEISIQITELKGVRMTISYIMTCRGETVCTGTSRHCFMNAEGRPIMLEKQYPAFCEALKELQE